MYNKGPFKDEKMNEAWLDSEPTLKKHLEDLDEATCNVCELCMIIANHHRDLNVDIELPAGRSLCLMGGNTMIRRNKTEFLFPIKEITLFERFLISDNVDLIYNKLEELNAAK